MFPTLRISLQRALTQSEVSRGWEDPGGAFKPRETGSRMCESARPNALRQRDTNSSDTMEGTCKIFKKKHIRNHGNVSKILNQNKLYSRLNHSDIDGSLHIGFSFRPMSFREFIKKSRRLIPQQWSRRQ